MEIMVDPAYWKNKKVLVTGHTGFKGSWLCHWLVNLGADVTGYALPPTEDQKLFELLNLRNRLNSINGNLNDREAMQRLVRGSSPDVIFHLAAQSLVLTSFEQPLETLSTNIIGTANLLEVLRSYNKTCDVIVVTSDKCYQNREGHKQHIETDHLGGVDPYSASKACAEIVTASYRNSFFSGDKSLIRVASARAGNVIGGGDWALNRLMPDVVRARIAAEPIKVRHPSAIRPWQHVLEPLFGYLLLAERLRTKPAFAKAWNFGPTVEVTTTVADVLESLRKLWPDLKLNVTEKPGPHEASILMLDSSQAATELGWHPRWKVETAVAETAAWYQAWQEGHDMSEFTTQQLNNYTRTDERP